MRLLLAITFALLNFSYFPGALRPRPAAARPPPPPHPSVAWLRIPAGGSHVYGTAFYIGGGLVLTAGHNFAPAGNGPPAPVQRWSGDPGEIELYFGAEAIAQARPARAETVLAVSYDGTPLMDYALLRIGPRNRPPDETALRLRRTVRAGPFSPLLLGFGEGRAPRRIAGRERAAGVGSGKLVSFSTRDGNEPGMSGGPILDLSDQTVVGINTSAVELENGNGLGVLGTSISSLAPLLEGFCARALLPEY